MAATSLTDRADWLPTIGQELAISGLPALAAATVVPLRRTLPTVGVYVLRLTARAAGLSWCLAVE